VKGGGTDAAKTVVHARVIAMNERRRFRRYGVSWNAEVSEAAASPFVVEVANVSEGGLCIVSVRTIDVGSTFFFKVTQWTGEPLQGVVRWVESFGGPTYAGIQFISVSEVQLAALKELVRSFDKEDWGGL
jgi:hypothetical protein